MTKSNGTKPRSGEPTPADCAPNVTERLVGSKRDQLRQRLEREGGASLKELESAFGWQPHTLRAAISGLRKAGHDVQREVGETGAIYRIAAPRGSA